MASHQRRWRLRQPNTDGNSYGNSYSYCYADSNGNTYSYCYVDSNGDAYSYCYADGNGDAYSPAEVYADAKAAAHATSTPISSSV